MNYINIYRVQYLRCTGFYGSTVWCIKLCVNSIIKFLCKYNSLQVWTGGYTTNILLQNHRNLPWTLELSQYSGMGRVTSLQFKIISNNENSVNTERFMKTQGLLWFYRKTCLFHKNCLRKSNEWKHIFATLHILCQWWRLNNVRGWLSLTGFVCLSDGGRY